MACNSSCAANPVANGTDALPGSGAPATAGLLSQPAALSRAIRSWGSHGVFPCHAVERLHRAAFLSTAQSAERHPHGLCLPHAWEAVAARSFPWPNRRRAVPRASAGLQTPRRRSRPAFAARNSSRCALPRVFLPSIPCVGDFPSLRGLQFHALATFQASAGFNSMRWQLSKPPGASIPCVGNFPSLRGLQFHALDEEKINSGSPIPCVGRRKNQVGLQFHALDAGFPGFYPKSTIAGRFRPFQSNLTPKPTNP